MQSQPDVVIIHEVGSFGFCFVNEQNKVVTLSNTYSPKGKGGVKSLYFLMNGLYTEK